MKFRLSPIAVAMLAIHAMPAVAQQSSTSTTSDEPSKDQATQLSGVKVEADVEATSPYKADAVQSPKFTQPLRDTPQTIQVITKELFNQQGATSLTEALRNSPAVGTFYAGENGSTTTGDTIYMRGFDASSSIFVDGVRDLGSVTHDLFNIDQVEVEKGPAGTDNGRTSPSGAINLVTKQANLDNAISGTLTTGTDGQHRATADLNQRLDAIPGAALRLNVLWQDSDVAGRDHVNNSRSGIAPSLGFGLNTDTRAYIDLFYVKQNNVPDGFVPTIGLPTWTPQTGEEALVGHPVDSSNYYGTRYDHDDDTSKMATLRLEHDFSEKLKVRNIARWGETSQDYMLTSFMGTSANVTTSNPDDPSDLSAYTLARSNLNTKDQINKILTDQLNLTYEFETGLIKHSLSTGLEVTREELYSHDVSASGVSAANLYDPDWNDVGTLTVTRPGSRSHGRTDTESAYAFDTLKFFEDRLLVTGGVRFDHYKTDYLATGVCNTEGYGVNSRRTIYCNGADLGDIVTSADASDSDTLFNWKLGVVYKPVEAASLYADYALAQQPPGGSNFQLAAASDTSLSANSINADPQKTKTAELGAKWDALDGLLSLNGALFRTEVSNEINSDDLDENGAPTQTGKKRVQGVELSAVGNITENWSISAGYTYQKTKIEDGPTVTSDGSSNLTYTPKDAFTSWTTYRLPYGVTIGGGARYVAGLHKGSDGGDTAGGGATPSSTSSYTVWDAVASYDVSRNFTLRANAYNVFDKDYIAAINKSGYRYQPGTPRTFLFSADFRF
ncbi:catecholate siderophore receptor Fiu [Solimonas marina]|uniref:Catecholate siderophore receptor Fiu n=1 Tax=Solimonas marina TaxID=2714601 RepID=A0A969W851_9GAMM|nr:catecholate siderophore receptor Fiu [Solimonas marina]NKF22466.1 catecholate siderophore receptor Fiu [Solimonas marina]